MFILFTKSFVFKIIRVGFFPLQSSAPGSRETRRRRGGGDDDHDYDGDDGRADGRDGHHEPVDLEHRPRVGATRGGIMSSRRPTDRPTDRPSDDDDDVACNDRGYVPWRHVIRRVSGPSSGGAGKDTSYCQCSIRGWTLKYRVPQLIG